MPLPPQPDTELDGTNNVESIRTCDCSMQPMKRVAIFVDVQNIYYTTRQAYASNFDYNAFWRRATAGRIVAKATAFAIDRADEKQRLFQNVLRGIGFEVKLKPYISSRWLLEGRLGRRHYDRHPGSRRALRRGRARVGRW